MSIFALQSAAGGFLDEWCIQFDNYEDANLMRQNLGKKVSPDIVEISPLVS